MDDLSASQSPPDDHDWELKTVEEAIPYFQCKNCDLCFKGNQNMVGVQNHLFTPPTVETSCPPNQDETPQ